jgi:hypothetical protein
MKTLASLLRISLLVFLFAVSFWAYSTLAQTETGTISGLITDETGAAVPGAQVQLLNVQRGTTSDAKTNNAGLYIFSGVEAGQYQVKVQKPGFKQVDLLSLIVNVQDHIEQNVRLQIGSVSESVTVNAEESHINTTDATVSTVIDRNFAENIPMNGRSFQTLIELTPGVVTVAAGTGSGGDTGQFSVNGQRPDANYWMVDGVSANAGSNAELLGNQMAGATGITSVLGGTNSLVSVDAMQEFRIQTSTFAPEFGRTPGAQISIVTRSGANAFHGSVFDYLRNDKFDANNWFNGFTNNPPLHKAEERQNDFGGTFSGPILKGRTFFFFSYEGLRLRLPTTTQTTVPDLNARRSALPALQPFFNAFPLPNGPEVDSSSNPLLAGQAQFNASYSAPATLDAYSLRIDHKLTDRFTLFGRYNYSPSEISTRGSDIEPLSNVNNISSTAQQGTVGLNGTLTPNLADELRFNYSRADSGASTFLDNFHGAVPFTSPVPSPYSPETGQFIFFILFLNHGEFTTGPVVHNLQRQWNVVDTVTAQKGSHSLKFGVDYRRLTPLSDPSRYAQLGLLLDVPSAQEGQLIESIAVASQGATLLFRNLSLFAQDSWRASNRLNLTYGLRWDTDFAPVSVSGPSLVSATGFNPSDLSNIALAPSGTPPFHTNFRNFAPRFGAAYQIAQQPNWALVARGGFGVFYDLATSETANIIMARYPFEGSQNTQLGGTFPLGASASAAPPIAPPSSTSPGDGLFFNPNLKSPYTLEWNVALEQALGRQQSLSITYVGAAGRDLLQPNTLFHPNPEFRFATFVSNTATSDYHALQARFERRLSRGLQVFSSYTWAHSIDTGSAGSFNFSSNESSGLGNPGNRGPSSFDIRHAFSTGITYAIPSVDVHPIVRQITRGWSVQSIFEAHTALPVDVSVPRFQQLANNLGTDVRPDVLPGIPLYLYGSQYPGGKAFNDTPGAGTCSDGTPSVGPFCAPAADANGNPSHQGDLGRNALRGLGMFQWNLGVHRDFPIHESLALQFRAEMFNVLNHPNFAPPSGGLGSTGFGRSSQILSDYLGGGAGFAGGFNSLYQVGGPRSMQFALKLSF